MGPVLEEIFKTGFADGKSVPLENNVPVAVGEFLQKIITDVKPHTSIEVGLWFGISTLFICEALDRESRHIVMDPYQHTDCRGLGLLNLRRAGYDVEFYGEESQIVLPRLWTEGLTIDFAFIDGRHNFDHVLADFFYVDKMLRSGGVIAFDDCDWPSVQKVCRYIITNRSYRVYGASGGGHTFSESRVVLPLMRMIPRLRRHLKPEALESARVLGLTPNRCIAFTKQSDDMRCVDFHREF